MRMFSRSFSSGSITILLCAALLTACGGGSGNADTTPVAATYSLGGTVSGIQSGNQVTLSNNGDTITVAGNGNFTFDKGLVAGTAFNVVVNSPSQPCIALFSSGAMTAANVSSVQVQCGPQEQKTFHPAGSINVPRSSAALYALSDGSAVLVGGYLPNGASGVPPFEHYNPVSQTWTTYQTAPQSQIYGSAQLKNGTILITTGAATQIFDPVAGTLSAPNPFASSSGFYILVPLLDGRVLASDSYNIELLDPNTGKWVAGPPIPGIQPANNGVSFVLLESGKVLASGGLSGLSIPGAIPNSEIFDPVSLTWTVTGSMLIPTEDHSTILMPGGKVLAIGGYPVALGGDWINDGELFDPTIGQWSVAGAVSTERGGSIPALMPTGKVLLMGGEPYTQPATALSSTEIYDPQTNSWSAWGNMLNAREYQSAVLLSSGQLLVAGGYTVIPTYPYTAGVASAELGW